MNQTGEIAFDGRLLRATLFNMDSPRLIVSFRQRIAEPGAFQDAQPIRSFLKDGYAHLHIQSLWNDWFINTETAELESILTEIGSAYGDARAIGFSMGGFGALRFARALRLGQVLLISSQVSIDPGVVPWDRRFRSEASGFDPVQGDLTRVAKADLKGHVVFDPFNRWDRLNAREICRIFPRLQMVRLPGGGHPATRVIRSLGRFGEVQKLLRTGAVSRPALLELHRSGRGESALYWRHLVRRLERSNHADWLAHARAIHSGLEPA